VYIFSPFMVERLEDAQVSEFKHGKFDRFSSDRQIALLGAMGCDVELRVTPAPRRRAGRFAVKAA
jgi:hypothetical protein